MTGWYRSVRRLGVLAVTLSALTAVGTVGCGDSSSNTDADTDGDASKKKKKKEGTDATPSASVTATASASASAAPQGGENPPSGDGGPMVKIPSGTLRAGSKCYDIPRVRPNELEHNEVAMGEFEMDLYPYPNEAGKPAKLGATWQEAKDLCEARGKRLCTELEWERACKGPKNTTYMWGDNFKKAQCDGRTDHQSNQRPECKTKFEVMDMMGLSLEWTASEWERGSPNGERVVRGARAEKVSWLSARCAHSRKRDPNKGHDNVGFRCCKGDENTAKVQLRQRQRSWIEEEPDIDTEYEMMLMRAMKKDHRAIVGTELSFDKVWRWHPVPNEEMIVARWKGKPDSGGSFYEIAVFKVCNSYAWLAASMRGPVEKIGKPKRGINSRKLTFDLSTDGKQGELNISYWHGYVKFKDQPSFVKKGNQLKVKGKKRRIRPKIEAKPR